MNSKKRHLDLLRKRYRLPISLLTHEIPPGSPLRESGFEESVNARGKLKVTGLVTCVHDARDLISLCSSRGVEKLCIRYADYISLSCVHTVKQEMQNLVSLRAEARESDSAHLKIVILNPGVPKEKMRLLAKLDTLSSKLLDVLSLVKEGNTPQQQQRLVDLRFQIGTALEEATVNADSAELIKKSHLDWLLLLELGFDAPPTARQEGMWLLKHIYPAEHAYIHVDGKCVRSALAMVRKGFRDKVVDREDIPSSANLSDARQGLLGAVGRHHLENSLSLALQKTHAVIDRYLREEATKIELIDVINLQLKVLQNLMSKRSLIGCRFLDLNDDNDNSDDTESTYSSTDSGHEGSIQGEHDPEKDNISISSEDVDEVEDGDAFLVDEDDEMPISPGGSGGSESSVDSPVQSAIKKETPISASSFVSTFSEIGDSDFARLLKLGHNDEDKYEDLNLEKSGKLSDNARCATTATLSPSSVMAPSPTSAAPGSPSTAPEHQ